MREPGRGKGREEGVAEGAKRRRQGREAGCVRGRGKSYPPRARYGTHVLACVSVVCVCGLYGASVCARARAGVWVRVTSYSRPRGFPFFITRRVQRSNPALRSTAQLSNAATTTRLRHDGRTHTGAAFALSHRDHPSRRSTLYSLQPTCLNAVPYAFIVRVSSSITESPRSGVIIATAVYLARARARVSSPVARVQDVAGGIAREKDRERPANAARARRPSEVGEPTGEP